MEDSDRVNAQGLSQYNEDHDWPCAVDYPNQTPHFATLSTVVTSHYCIVMLSVRIYVYYYCYNRHCTAVFLYLELSSFTLQLTIKYYCIVCTIFCASLKNSCVALSMYHSVPRNVSNVPAEVTTVHTSEVRGKVRCSLVESIN